MASYWTYEFTGKAGTIILLQLCAHSLQHSNTGEKMEQDIEETWGLCN